MRTIMLKCRAICSKITDLGLDSLDKEKAASQNISEREQLQFLTSDNYVLRKKHQIHNPAHDSNFNYMGNRKWRGEKRILYSLP